MKKHTRKSGFTLIEMLVVIAIIVLLAVAVIPNISEIFAASLTQGGFSLSGTLSLARQAAIAQNHDMEVRLYQYADPNFTGEVANSPSTGKYRGFQIFQISDTGSVTPYNMMQRLPEGIIMDSGTQLSSLFGTTQIKVWTSSDPQISLPGIGTSYNCMAFRMHEDGSTNLSSSPPSTPNAWCVTLHRNNLGDNLATPPLDFITIQIDPVSGKLTTFHP